MADRYVGVKAVSSLTGESQDSFFVIDTELTQGSEPDKYGQVVSRHVAGASAAKQADRLNAEVV